MLLGMSPELFFVLRDVLPIHACFNHSHVLVFEFPGWIPGSPNLLEFFGRVPPLPSRLGSSRWIPAAGPGSSREAEFTLGLRSLLHGLRLFFTEAVVPSDMELEVATEDIFRRSGERFGGSAVRLTDGWMPQKSAGGGPTLSLFFLFFSFFPLFFSGTGRKHTLEAWFASAIVGLDL